MKHALNQESVGIEKIISHTEMCKMCENKGKKN